MSHEVQLSPAASHCPTAVLDPAGHAAEPPACRSRCPYFPGRAYAGYCPTLEIRSARPSFTLCVPKTLSMSCGQAIFVDQATAASLFSDAVLAEIDWFG
jgi:hypothetical protein